MYNRHYQHNLDDENVQMLNQNHNKEMYVVR
jgi:hypothetical protein